MNLLLNLRGSHVTSTASATKSHRSNDNGPRRSPAPVDVPPPQWIQREPEVQAPADDCAEQGRTSYYTPIRNIDSLSMPASATMVTASASSRRHAVVGGVISSAQAAQTQEVVARKASTAKQHAAQSLLPSSCRPTLMPTEFHPQVR